MRPFSRSALPTFHIHDFADLHNSSVRDQLQLPERIIAESFGADQFWVENVCRLARCHTGAMCASQQDSNLHKVDDRATPPSAAQVNSATRVPRRAFFDPWNSSSTGHQRAENRLSGSTSWRASRSSKLAEQYKGGLTGGRSRVADTVGAGSPDFGKDGRKENGGWEKGSSGLRTGGQRSLADVWTNRKTSKSTAADKGCSPQTYDLEEAQLASDSQTEPVQDTLEVKPPLQAKPIFEGLCFFVNGSTAPHVSDHKLKHMLSAHGGRHSIALGRRTVTHVVLGTVNAKGGCGGGLAATKLQKEVTRTGGKAIKYITVEWVLESIKAGRRLPESRFAPLKLAQQSQGSIFGTANRKNATGTAHG